MRIKRVGCLVVAVLVVQARCEVVCFRSVAEAAVQQGARDSGGYRVQGVRRDAFSGVQWASIVSCAHPERPAALVQSDAVAVAGSVRTLLVQAGAEVRVLRMEAATRLELRGFAVSSGAVGERIRVRMPAALAGAEERYVEATVRADGTLEMED